MIFFRKTFLANILKIKYYHLYEPMLGTKPDSNNNLSSKGLSNTLTFT